jgi:hypothetical protein
MRTVALTIVATLALTAAAWAQDKENISIRTGQQKSAMRGKVTLKVLSVGEDSRCPAKATCVWAGNASVKVQISISGSNTKAFELNTGLEPKTALLGGYSVTLTGLSPRPGEKFKGLASPHVATFTIERIRQKTR